MEPAEYENGLEAALWLPRSRNRLLLGESLVRARLAVEASELGYETLKVLLSEDENVVEQLAPECCAPSEHRLPNVRRRSGDTSKIGLSVET